MKRLGIIAVVALALAAIFGTTALAAKPAPSFVARANHAQQGGHLHVMAKVLHGDHHSTFSATADVAFAVPASVDLTRRGHSLTAGGKVSVPADAPLGPVTVVVTITYGADTAVLTIHGVIEPPDAP